MTQKSIKRASMKKKSIGAIVATAGILETAVSILKIGGNMLNWFKKKMNPKKRFFLWKIGSHDNPAGPTEIKDFEKKLNNISSGKSNTLVSDHSTYLEIHEIGSEDTFKVVPADSSEE